MNVSCAVLPSLRTIPAAVNPAEATLWGRELELDSTAGLAFTQLAMLSPEPWVVLSLPVGYAVREVAVTVKRNVEMSRPPLPYRMTGR